MSRNSTKNISYPKGSEWRSWDLHVHTPESILNNQFGSDWDKYIKGLADYAYKRKLAVIGITDYFTIEGYKKLKINYLNSEQKLKELINNSEVFTHFKNIEFIPNIEFRLDKFYGANRINYHVLLSPDIAIEDIEQEFLNSITFVYEGNLSQAPEKRGLTKRNLENLGKKLKKDHANFENFSDLYAGAMNATVSDNEISAILNNKTSIFKEKFFICIPSDEDLSNLKWDSQDHQARKVLIQSAHFLLTKNKSTINWGLGKKSPNRKDFINEFQSLKPSITGSDAHSLNDFNNIDYSSTLWIKADPTFEGLRQVLCEPDERVKIQGNYPDRKLAYNLIDKVRFVPKSTNRAFPSDYIELNSGLNAIIGGKSSGKSLLLYHIAKTIDQDQVSTKLNEKNGEKYQFSKTINYDFEVTWKDGEVNRLSEHKKSQIRNICYIPQMYVNTLVEDESNNSFHALIKSTLLENDKFEPVFMTFESNLEEKKRQLVVLVNSYITNRAKKQTIHENIKRIGDLDGLTKQSELLVAEIKQLESNSSLSEQDLYKYQTLSASKESLLISSRLISIDQETLQRITSKISTIRRNILQEFSSLEYPENWNLYSDESHRIDLSIERLQQSITHSINESLDFINSLQSKINQKTESIGKSLSDLEVQFEPLVGKITNGSLIKEKKEQLEEIQRKLSDLSLLINSANEIEIQSAKDVSEIWGVHDEIRRIHEAFIQQCSNENLDEITSDANLGISIQFKESDFNNRVIELLDKRNFKSIFTNNYDEETQKLTHIDAQGLQRKVFDELVSGILKQRVTSSWNDLIQRLFENYLSIKFSLIHRGEDISQMSPGKRGLIVLQLILHLSNSQSPVLIDQPEDNLDNRTIFDDLTKFIRQRKLQRQIIIVTHNANLVVSADAEEVIVANQNGRTDEELLGGTRFEYLSGSLEQSLTSHNPPESKSLDSKSIMEHVCEILEGGREAFRTRLKRYSI